MAATVPRWRTSADKQPIYWPGAAARAETMPYSMPPPTPFSAAPVEQRVLVEVAVEVVAIWEVEV